jgi:hypothetical protein
VVIYILNVFLLLVSGVFAAQKEIEVSTFYAKVYVAPSTNANFIGLIQKGERYPILGIKDGWYNIRFKNVNGWIEFAQAKVIDTDAVTKKKTAPSSAGTGVSPGSVVDSTAGAAVVKQVADTVRPSPEAVAPGAGQNQASKTTSSSGGISRLPLSSSRPAINQPRTVTTPARKSESRIRSWFSQQNTPELPPTINPNDDQSEPIRYFHISFPSAVREFLDPAAPILGMTKRGQVFQLIGEGDSWCKIAFADTIGWVEKKQGRIVDSSSAAPLDFVKISLAVGAIMFLLIAFFIFMRFRRTSALTIEASAVKKNIVIISKTSTTIQYTLTNGTIPLERTFTEVGFDVFFVKTGATLKSGLQQNKPDIIMIDYQFDGKIIPVVERLCISQGCAETIMAIVYNVPDPSIMHPGKSLPNMQFLGTSFSDRDVFKLITPMLRSTIGVNIQKSVQSSALAGNIAEGNLLEVLQFIEIGSKTGCLLVELDKPFAIICFKNGRISFAATANKIIGRDAIFKVLELKKGKFRFVLDKKPKESNVNLSTLEVLMEWTKTIDEAHGH